MFSLECDQVFSLLGPESCPIGVGVQQERLSCERPFQVLL